MQKLLNVLIVLALLLVTIALVIQPSPPLLWQKAEHCGAYHVDGKTIVNDWFGRPQYYLFFEDWPTQVSEEVYRTYYVGGTAAVCAQGDPTDWYWYVLVP